MENNVQTKNSIIKDLIPLFSVELVILALMNFAELSILYRIFAIVLMIFSIKEIAKVLPKSKAIIPYVLQVIFLLIFEIMTSLYGGYSQSIYDASTLFLVIAVMLGGGAFYILGMYYGLFDKLRNLDFSKIISAIYIGVGIYVLISLIATIYGMGTIFHVIKFANPLNGRVELQYSARILRGLETELKSEGVSILTNIALLSSTGIHVFLLTNKDNKILRYGSLFGGLCGFALLLLFPAFMALVLSLLSLGVVLIYKSKTLNKKPLYLGYLVIVALLITIYFVFRIDYHNNYSKYEDVGYLLKAFLTQNANLGAKFQIFKQLITTPVRIYGEVQSDAFLVMTMYTGNAIIDILYHCGIIPLLAFLAFLVLAFKNIIHFCKNEAPVCYKAALLGITICYFYRIMLYGNVGFIITHDFVFLGVLILLGYVNGYNAQNKMALK